MQIGANAERAAVHACWLHHSKCDYIAIATDGPAMAMLEHDATLHTRHGIERLMYRGRYSAETVSYTAPQPHPRALPKVLAQAITLAENCV